MQQFKMPHDFASTPTGLEHKFYNLDTAGEEMPAMPKSRYSNAGWDSGLPKPSYPMSWDAPLGRKIDFEKVAARIMWVGMALVTLLIASIVVAKFIMAVATLVIVLK